MRRIAVAAVLGLVVFASSGTGASVFTSVACPPPPRYGSNRTFNDRGQNLFAENGISQWGWVWGQFMDHDFGLRDETPAEHAPTAFDAADPPAQVRNEFG